MDLRLLTAVAAGGAGGALARHALTLAWPGSIWTVWAVNVVGCLLIGLLVPAAGPYLRALLGTGFLGGFTTFSTATLDTLLATPVVAATYLAATVLGALAACWAGLALGERWLRR